MWVFFLNFERGPGVLLLNFAGDPGVLLLNLRGSWVSWSWSYFYTMPTRCLRLISKFLT